MLVFMLGTREELGTPSRMMKFPPQKVPFPHCSGHLKLFFKLGQIEPPPPPPPPLIISEPSAQLQLLLAGLETNQMQAFSHKGILLVSSLVETISQISGSFETKKAFSNHYLEVFHIITHSQLVMS